MLTCHSSEEIYLRSAECMPGGVNSPVRAWTRMQRHPLVIQKGKGDKIWDVEGRSYIDYCMGWGSLILGHAPESSVRAAIAQIERGSSFGMATPYELDLAEKIKQHIPSIEKIRFVSSGTEATMSAIRLARGFTGKLAVVKFSGHYHGHSDALLVDAGSGVSHLPRATSAGIPSAVIQNTVSLPFNELELCRAYLRERNDIAAIILEPIAGNMGVIPAENAFIHMLREEATRLGAVLILDEVITGFRVGLGGAQAHYGIVPDLTCLGKIIGGGFPAAAFGGRKEIMDYIAPIGPVYQAGTLSGNPVAMCAGYTTLVELEQPGFYAELERKTKLLTDPIEYWLEQHCFPGTLTRVGSMFTLFFGPTQVQCAEDLKTLSNEQFRDFFLYLLERGIYSPPAAQEAWFVSMNHTEDHLLYTKDVILSFLESKNI